jgi:hypothetical protein
VLAEDADVRLGANLRDRGVARVAARVVEEAELLEALGGGGVATGAPGEGRGDEQERG